MADESKQLTPPYLPYRTFINSLENLREGIPPRLDRTIWRNQPGGVQSQIIGAYRFLGLVDENNRPTKILEPLVANRTTPGEQVKALVEENYAEIIKHGLKTMTTGALESLFGEAFGAEGETKRKGITFFLNAAKAAGLEMSSFLQNQTKASSGTRKRRTTKRIDDQDGAGDDDTEEQEQPSSGSTKTVELKSGGAMTLSVSVDVMTMSTDDRNFVFGLIDKLREYEQAHQQAPKAKPATDKKVSVAPAHSVAAAE